MNEEEDDTVRLDNEKRPVWLIRVPPRLAKAWDAVKEEDKLVGKLRIHTSETEQDNIKITFHTTGGEQEAITLAATNDFTFKFNDSQTPMRVFSKGHGGVEMQGFVEHSFFMQPMQSQMYQNAVQRRVKIANTKTRVTKELDSWDAMRFQQKARVVKISEEDEAANDAKRRKLGIGSGSDDTKLRESLFALFSRRDHDDKPLEYWTMKDMRNELGATEAQLRPLIREVCEYHNSGEFARHYGLKAEYKSKASA